MPKSTTNLDLQKRLAEFVDASGGVRPASRLMGLEHTMVWRFTETGRAIPRTHQAISAALAKHESATEKAPRGTASGSSEVGGVPLANVDLLFLRNLCSSVITLIDNYNGAGSNLAPPRG